MASMQGSNILGEKKKEAKARSPVGLVVLIKAAQDLPEGLGSGQEAQIRTKTSGEPPAELWEKGEGERNGWV